MAKKLSNAQKARNLYARMVKANGGKRPARQAVMKRLMGKAFGSMSQAGASSYYGTMKDIPLKDFITK